ncbi:MAG: thrombospondin type 3 repeat-containing protein, partial [Pseudomonadales bacterium]|nr:thrombospondin type 3 repeat-containing protein [Pseudomonadales bacterium]
VQSVDPETRTALMGDGCAPPVEVYVDDGEKVLTQTDSLTPIAFNAADIPGEWGLVAQSNPDAWSGSFLSTADLATFNVDNTGSTLLFGRTFTWQVDADGVLVMTFDDDGTVIRHTLLNQFANNAMGVLSETTTPAGEDYTSYTLAMKRDAQAAIDPLVGQFLMNSFTLTSPYSYDETGKVFPYAYFGFRPEPGGLLRNIWSADGLNFGQTYWAGWTPWYWSTEADNTVVLETRRTPGGPYSVCYTGSPDCNRERVRKWIPLGQVGDRIYVLEWEEWNLNSETFPSEAEELVYNIAPRVQFYEAFELDIDQDGTPDSQDTDIDGDGIANDVDDLPEDPTSSTDSDGDGIGDERDNCVNTVNRLQFDSDYDGLGDLCDSDVDGDGTPNAEDAFVLDPAEQVDADGDGVGDNAALDPNDPAIGTALPFTSS